MKKTISQYFCDECQKPVEFKDLFILLEKEFCGDCLLKRIQISLKMIPIGEKCESCNGNKGTKEFYGYHNEHNWKKCNICEGTGLKIFCCDEDEEFQQALATLLKG